MTFDSTTHQFILLYTKICEQVTTDYNAGFTSALGALRHLALIGQLPTEYR